MTSREQDLQRAFEDILKITRSVEGGEERDSLYRKFGRIQGIAEFYGEWLKPKEIA